MNLQDLVEPGRVHRRVYTDPAIFDRVENFLVLLIQFDLGSIAFNEAANADQFAVNQVE